MEQTWKNYDVGLEGDEILNKKTDNDIKSNKCNQCDYASGRAGDLRRHMKSQTYATNVTMHPPRQAI